MCVCVCVCVCVCGCVWVGGWVGGCVLSQRDRERAALQKKRGERAALQMHELIISIYMSKARIIND